MLLRFCLIIRRQSGLALIRETLCHSQFTLQVLKVIQVKRFDEDSAKKGEVGLIEGEAFMSLVLGKESVK